MISRKTGTVIIAGIILVIAGVIVTSMMLATSPSIIQINNGTFKIIELPYTYTRNDAYVLVIGSTIAGMMLSYILTTLFAAGNFEVIDMPMIKPIEPDNIVPDTAASAIGEVENESRVIDAILTALEGDERRLVRELSDNGGGMLQNELVLSLNFSKAKVSRMLTDLEKRGLVIKKPYGLTNRVVLADKFRGGKNEK